jgi:hypothetical protein
MQEAIRNLLAQHHHEANVNASTMLDDVDTYSYELVQRLFFYYILYSSTSP